MVLTESRPHLSTITQLGIAVLTCVMLLSTSCSSSDSDIPNFTTPPSNGGGTNPTTPTPPTNPENPGVSNVMLTLINAERAAEGIQPLTWNSQLVEAAERHSSDMARNNFLDHVGSDGSTFDQRIAATGYRLITGGENIAVGFTSEDSVMQAWMNSPGHRANILNSNFREVGVSRIGDYWTQNFATPRGSSKMRNVIVPSKKLPEPLELESISADG